MPATAQGSPQPRRCRPWRRRHYPAPASSPLPPSGLARKRKPKAQMAAMQTATTQMAAHQNR
ncbi:MAG: hypothetical protein KHY37_06125 [Actinomyces graevenitzii]|nr:hypothetical protein [Actinomyces graevenitzii]